MKTCLVAAENTEDNLLVKNMAFWVLEVQWLHFIGEVDKSKITYFKFLQGLVCQSYSNRFIFG